MSAWRIASPLILLHHDKLEFARSNEPCVDFHKKARCELAHKRDLLWKDTYGECRDIEPQRSGGEMSAWRIASPLILLHHDKLEFAVQPLLIIYSAGTATP